MNAAEVHHFKWSRGVGRRLEDHFQAHQRRGYNWAKKEIPQALKLIRHGLNLRNPRLRVRSAIRLGV